MPRRTCVLGLAIVVSGGTSLGPREGRAVGNGRAVLSMTRAAVVRAESAGCRGAPPPPLFEAAVSLLRVELASDGVACCSGVAAAGATGLLVRFAVACGDTAIDVRVVDEPSGRISERRLDLTDVPPAARSRTLALAAAESVRSLRREHALAAAPSTTPEAPAGIASAPGPQSPANASSWPWPSDAALGASLGLAPLVRVFPRSETVAWGGALEGGLWRGPWWAGVGLDLSLARRTLSEGTVSLRLATATLAAGARLATGRTSVTLGPCLALGQGTIRGTAARADVRGAEGGGWSWVLGGRVTLAHELGESARRPADVGAERPPRRAPRYAVFAVVSAGGVLRALDATVDERRVAGASGFVGTFTVGVAWLGGG